VNVEEDDDDPRNINISKIEGSGEIRGPSLEDPNIITPQKMKQVNIEAEPKYAMLGDYWDDATVDKVVELLHKYQDLF